MRKNLKKLTIMMILSLILICVGCNNKGDNEEKSKETVNDNFPITVKNYDNTELTVNDKPKRIASLTLGMDEMVLEMVSDDKIVGLSGKNADNEAISNVAKKAAKFPKIENNIEILLGEKPDLVVGSSWIKPEFLQQLKDNDITYYGYKTPNTIEEQKQVILELSKILGEEKKGQDIVDDINKRINTVKEQIKESKDKDVKVMAYNMHGSTSGDKTMFNDIVKQIGAKNVSAEAGLEKLSKISKEKIIELNPQVLILMAWEKDDLKQFEAFADSIKDDLKQFEAFADSIKDDKSLENVDAIKNNRVYIASNRYMTSVSHHIIEGIEFMAKSVYPDVYEK